MKINKAIEILENHNKWRRDNDGKYEMADPKQLGIAIDTIITEVKSNICRSFKSESELRTFIDWYLPLAVKPIKPAKTMFVNVFASENAQNIYKQTLIEKLTDKSLKIKIDD